MNLEKSVTIGLLASLCALCHGLAQQPSATPKSLNQITKENDDWIRQNFPSQQTATPTSPSDEAREIRDNKIRDARQQLEVDMALKHQFDPKWSYSESIDPMGRGVTKIAEVRSTNSVTFGFPYTGEQQATLRIQNWPSSFNNGARGVFLTIERSQFSFQYDSGDAVATLFVRFDDGQIERFPGTQLTDGRMNVVSIYAADKFIASLRKAKKLAIEAEFFKEGRRVFEFDVRDLDKSW
jgi:hypothetical protein